MTMTNQQQALLELARTMLTDVADAVEASASKGVTIVVMSRLIRLGASLINQALEGEVMT